MGIVRTKYLKWTTISKKHKDVVEAFASRLAIPLFESSFRQRQEVQNALSARKFILERSEVSIPAIDIKAITEEFVGKVEGVS